MPQTPPDSSPPGDSSGEISGELVVVARFKEAHRANVALGRLKTDGLQAFLADEHTVSANWLYSDATGGVRLMVPASQAGRAVEILETHQEQ